MSLDAVPDRQADRGPSATAADDPPQSPRGMWRLLAVPGMDHVRAVAVARHHYSFATLDRASEGDLARLVGRKVARWVVANGVPRVALPTPVDGQVLTPWSAGFPPWLREVPGTPPLLWVRGLLPARHDAVAVTCPDGFDYGVAVARRAAGAAAAAGVPVVCGPLPDPTVRLALAAGAVPVWVVDGPAESADAAVAAAVVAAGGAVVAEHPPEDDDGVTVAVSSRAWTRLLPGVAAATLVCGGQVGSAQADVARFTLVQGRTLWTPSVVGGHRTDLAATVPVGLSDPSGCPPALLAASGRLGAQLANRRPAADVVLADGPTLERVVAELADRI